MYPVKLSGRRARPPNSNYGPPMTVFIANPTRTEPEFQKQIRTRALFAALSYTGYTF